MGGDNLAYDGTPINKTPRATDEDVGGRLVVVADPEELRYFTKKENKES